MIKDHIIFVLWLLWRNKNEKFFLVVIKQMNRFFVPSYEINDWQQSHTHTHTRCNKSQVRNKSDWFAWRLLGSNRWWARPRVRLQTGSMTDRSACDQTERRIGANLKSKLLMKESTWRGDCPTGNLERPAWCAPFRDFRDLIQPENERRRYILDGKAGAENGTWAIVDRPPTTK